MSRKNQAKQHQAKQQALLQKQSAKALLRKQKAKQKKKIGVGKFLTTHNGLIISKHHITSSWQHNLYECRINENWQEAGLASIWLTRKTPDYIIVGVYFIDLQCLGLKNTSVSAFRTNSEYRSEKFRYEHGFAKEVAVSNLSYDLANQIIYGGIAYAKSLGFAPHKDFSLSKHILAAPIKSSAKIHFGGLDGKPMYISGPYDNPREIVDHLVKTVGMEGFHYLIGVSEPNEK